MRYSTTPSAAVPLMTHLSRPLDDLVTGAGGVGGGSTTATGCAGTRAGGGDTAGTGPTGVCAATGGAEVGDTTGGRGAGGVVGVGGSSLGETALETIGWACAVFAFTSSKAAEIFCTAERLYASSKRGFASSLC